MLVCGVYQIKNIVNGHRYVGSTRWLQNRWANHRWELRTGRHHSVRLQYAWDKYGEGAFEFTLLEKCEIADLLVKEQQYLDKLKPEYNILRMAEQRRTWSLRSEAQKQRAKADTLLRQQAKRDALADEAAWYAEQKAQPDYMGLLLKLGVVK